MAPPRCSASVTGLWRPLPPRPQGLKLSSPLTARLSLPIPTSLRCTHFPAPRLPNLSRNCPLVSSYDLRNTTSGARVHAGSTVAIGGERERLGVRGGWKRHCGRVRASRMQRSTTVLSRARKGQMEAVDHQPRPWPGNGAANGTFGKGGPASPTGRCLRNTRGLWPVLVSLFKYGDGEAKARELTGWVSLHTLRQTVHRMRARNTGKHAVSVDMLPQHGATLLGQGNSHLPMPVGCCFLLFPLSSPTPTPWPRVRGLSPSSAHCHLRSPPRWKGFCSKWPPH